MLSLLNSKLERSNQEDSKVQINTLLVGKESSPVKDLVKFFLSMCENKCVSMMTEPKFHHYFSTTINQNGKEIKTCGQFTTSKNLVIHIPSLDKVHHSLISTLIDKMSTVNVNLNGDNKPSLLQQTIPVNVYRENARPQAIVKTNLVTVIASTPDIGDLSLKPNVQDETKGTGLPPYLINAFDLVLNVTSFDEENELKQNSLSTMHLFLGNLKNTRLIDKSNQEKGLPAEKTNIMTIEELIKYFDALREKTLPFCPDQIIKQLKNYDEMLNSSYSQLKSLVLLVRSHALLLGRKIVTEFDLVSIVLCFELLAGDRKAFDFQNEKDEAILEVFGGAKSGNGVIFKTIKEYLTCAGMVKGKLEDQDYKMFVSDDEEDYM